MKIIPKSEQGLTFLLSNLAKLKNHNEAFFKNTFKFLTESHKPYPNSMIYYNVDTNQFLFKNFNVIDRLQKRTWNNYDYTGVKEPIVIKEHTFLYLTVEPFYIYVAKADWLLEKDKDKLKQNTEAFVLWFHAQCDKERENLKQYISYKNKENSNKLF